MKNKNGYRGYERCHGAKSIGSKKGGIDAKRRHEMIRAVFNMSRLLHVKGIFVGIEHAFWLVEGDVFNAQVLEDGEEDFSDVGKGDGAVMRILLGDEDVAVEAAHFGDGKDADAAEGLGSSRQDFTLSDIGPELSAGRALKSEEGNRAFCDIAFEGAAGNVRRAAVF